MLKRFFHINLNCKNFDRSLAFYKMLRFKVVREIGEGGGKVFQRGFHIPNNNARAATREGPRNNWLRGTGFLTCHF